MYLKILKFIIIFHIVVAGLLATIIYYQFRVKPPKLLERAKIEKPYDVIIVPGVPFRNGKWSKIMEARVRWSVYLFNRGITRNIIYSGSSVYTPYVESKIMKLYAMELGIPKENIFVETQAEHSTENLVYSYRMAKLLGFKKIALATDPFQNAMLNFYEGNFSPPVDEIPVDFQLLRALPYSDISIIYDSALVDSFTSLPEREGFWERLQGTMGKKIKKDTSGP